MKKISIVVLVALLVSMVTYGYDPGNWEDSGDLPETWTSDAVGIGTDSPDEMLHVKATFAKLYLESTQSPGSDWKIYAKGSDGSLRIMDYPNGSRLMIDNAGNVGIGTTSPQSELSVDGEITTKKITVTLDGWSDFVFTDNYQLMPLDELAHYINVNKGLPGIPTEKEVLDKGIELGKMQAKLLEKVEELTLYMIELKKENEELKRRISVLEK